MIQVLYPIRSVFKNCRYIAVSRLQDALDRDGPPVVHEHEYKFLGMISAGDALTWRREICHSENTSSPTIKSSAWRSVEVVYASQRKKSWRTKSEK